MRLQDEINNAHSHPEFLLQQRVADVMLCVSDSLSLQLFLNTA